MAESESSIMTNHGNPCEHDLSTSAGHAGPEQTRPPRLVCRVLPRGRASGSWNMALDEAILDLAAATNADAFLRFYEWTEPTLSLGYFQNHGDIDRQLAGRQAAVVRRPTGGGAIWHDRELTYCLVLPRRHPRTRPNPALYRIVHLAIAEALRSFGVTTAFPAPDQDHAETERPFLCFTDLCEFDLAIEGSKVVGSAQRRREGAILQHGSILLEASPGLPALEGLGDRAPNARFTLDDLERSLRVTIAQALDLELYPAHASEALLNRARELEHSRYSTLEWTRRRT